MDPSTVSENSIGGLIIQDVTTTGPSSSRAALAASGIRLTNASPIHVAMVDASGDQITSFGGGTQYTEDAVAPGDPVGTAVALVREDSPVSIAADGDIVAQRATEYGAAYTQIVDSSGNFIDSFGGSGGTAAADDADFVAGTTSGTPSMGVYESTPSSVTDGDLGIVGISQDRRLLVDIDDGGGSVTVDNSGTFATQVDGDALTALQLIDDAIHTDDAAFTLGSGKGVMIMGFAGTQSVDANDAGAIAIDTDGAVQVSDGGNSLTVDGTVTANLSATDNAVLDQIETNTSYGDNTGGGTEAGALRVTIANNSTGVVSVDDNGGALTVDNAGTFATQVDGDALTALQLIDDVVHVDDAAFTLGTSKGVMMMGFAGTQSVNANDAGAIAMDTDGAIHISDGGNTITVDGTVTANLGATDNAVLDAIQAAVETIDNVVSGSEAQVDVVASLPAGTNNIGDVDVASITNVTFTNAAIQMTGDEAHDAADAGNPLKVGGRAQAPTAALEEVADNDRVDAAFDRQGRIATWMGYPVLSADINDSSSGDNTIVAAAGAGLRIAVLGCVIVSDGTTDVRWEDGAGGTAFTGQIPLQAREGFVMPIGPQPWFVGTANTLLNLELTAAVNVHGIVSYVEMTD